MPLFVAANWRRLKFPEEVETSTRIRATYNHGVFVPLPGQLPTDLPEDAEVEITVTELPAAVPIEAAARAALLREIAESMKANQFTGNPPRFSREELHERR